MRTMVAGRRSVVWMLVVLAIMGAAAAGYRWWRMPRGEAPAGATLIWRQGIVHS